MKKIRQSLSDMIAEFGDILGVENIEAYKDLYSNVDKTVVDKIFAETVSKIKDSDDFVFTFRQHKHTTEDGISLRSFFKSAFL